MSFTWTSEHGGESGKVFLEEREVMAFIGQGAGERAKKACGELTKEAERAGTGKAARGRCKLGAACDADRLNVRLEDASDALVASVVLCAGHLGRTKLGRIRASEASEASEGVVAGSSGAEAPPGGAGGPGLGKGRKRRVAVSP